MLRFKFLYFTSGRWKGGGGSYSIGEGGSVVVELARPGPGSLTENFPPEHTGPGWTDRVNTSVDNIEKNIQLSTNIRETISTRSITHVMNYQLTKYFVTVFYETLLIFSKGLLQQ